MANTGNTQQQINYGAAVNDGTGDPLRTAFIKTDDNFDNVWLAGPVGSNITITNNTMQVNNTNGNLVLSPNGTGAIQTNSRLLPRLNNTYDLGSTTLRYRTGYFGSGGLIVDGNVAITGNLSAGNISYTGNVFVGDLKGSVYADDSTIMVDAVDNRLFASGATISGNISADYFIGNGALLTGLAATYGNANVSAYLASGTAIGNISTSGNINVSANVVALGNVIAEHNSVAIGNVSGGNIISVANVIVGNQLFAVGSMFTPGNVQGSYILGNGRFLTGLAATYGNANVISLLSAFGANTIFTTGNIQGAIVAPGGNGQVMYNRSGVIGASPYDFNFDESTFTLYVKSASFSGEADGTDALYVGAPGYTFLGSDIMAQITGNVDSYSQINFQNINPGSLASGDYILTADNGTDSTYYLDMGMASSNHADPDFFGDTSSSNDAYIYVVANDQAGSSIGGPGNLILGSTNGAIKMFVGNTAQANVVATVESDQLLMSGNIVPASSNSYSLGNSTNQWSDLYVSNATIYMNNIPISLTSGNVLTIDGQPILSNDSNTSITTTGNISAGNITTTRADLGNLTLEYATIRLADGAAENDITISPNIEGSAYVQVPNDANANTANLRIHNDAGNVEIGAAGAQLWYFNNSGNLYVPGAIKNLTNPVDDQDAATKSYVDAVAQGLHVHDSCNVATTQDLATYTGATVTYNNGAGGVGATLTFSGNTLTTVDGYSLTNPDRILVKNEANAVFNGIYVYSNNTVLTRAVDFDTDVEGLGGDFVFVTSGNVNADTGWVQTTDAPSIGNSNIVWQQFSAAGSYTANTDAGLFLNGSEFNAKVDNVTTAFDLNGNIVVKAGAALTTPNIDSATGTSLTLTGNLSAAYILGNGSQLTGLPASYTDSNVTTLLASLGSNTISTTGNVTAGYFIGNGSQLTGVANLSFTTVSANGTSIVADSATDTLTLTPGNNLIITGNATSDTVTLAVSDAPTFTGNVTAQNFVGNISVTGNVTGTSANVTLVAGSSNWTFDNTGNTTYPNGIVTFPGAATTGVYALDVGAPATFLSNTVTSFTANVNNYTQVTLQNINAGADATADCILTADNGSDTVNYGDFGIINSGYDVNTPTNSLGNIVYAGDTYVYAQGNTSNTSQSGGNLVIGTTTATKNVKIFAGGNNNSALIANISNTGVSVSGAVTATGNLNTGGNINSTAFTGGNISWSTNNQTDFQGSIKVGGSGIIKSPGGASSITLNNNGANIGTLGVTASTISTSTSTGALIVSGGAGIAGNLYAGNLYTTGLLSVTGNVSGGNLITTGQVNATGNVTGGNISATGIVSGNNNFVINAPSPTVEGGQLTIAWANVSGLTGQANSTWNLDVDSSSNVRLFYQNATAATGVLLQGNVTGNLVTFPAAGGISVTGNVSASNVSVSGNITGNTNGFTIGYLNIPQVSFAANATIALTDAGKHYYSTSASNLVLTVANNASVGFSIGTAINLINLGTGIITIAQGSGVTMYYAGNSTAGNRTVSSYGAATIQKVATDTWFLVGVGIT